MERQIASEPLEPLIVTVRGQRVLLDADLARLYGVATKRFNEAFKRNRGRFPEDFAFQLTEEEFDRLRARSSQANTQPPDSSRDMWSQFATTSQRRRGHLPWAFTEHGALMAANVLRSDRPEPPKRRIGFHSE